jgi:hypothetical protein
VEAVERLDHGVVALPRRRPVGGAALEHEPQRQDALRLHADLHVVGSPGDREVTHVAVLDEPVGRPQLGLVGLLVGDAHEVDADVAAAGHLASRHHHRRERALHVVGAAADQAVAVDARLELLRWAGTTSRCRGRRSSAPARRPTVAASTGRPLKTASLTSMSRPRASP